MMELVTKCLGQICGEGGGIIRTGPFGSQLHQFDYERDGTPVIMPKNIISGRISTKDIARVGEEHVLRLSQHRLEVGDIVYGRRGDIGRHAFIRESERGWLCGTGCLRISLGNSVVNPKFLHYYLNQEDVIDWITKQAVGSTMPNLNTAILRSVPVTFPPLSSQSKIAVILSAYDNLIENNLRRIKILEEMAKNLYREWFVKFRFPGHQKARFIDSPLGRIPEGWEVKDVQNTFAILGGGTPSKAVSEYWVEGTINWYSPSDLTATGSMFMVHSSKQISEFGLKKSSAQLFPAFSVMMTSRATLGVIAINTTEACTNQGFITCIPSERFPLYTLYHWLKENVEYFISLGSGATFKEITKGVFKTIELVVPAQDIVIHFEDTVRPFALQVLNLQRKNTTLRRTRDLLLPKLISGQVDVSELDIAVSGEDA
jgi:type I restriction enzyme S subunit